MLDRSRCGAVRVSTSKPTLCGLLVGQIALVVARRELITYFLGLRPLAGYASLKLYHVMSCFLYKKRILCYDMAG